MERGEDILNEKRVQRWRTEADGRIKMVINEEKEEGRVMDRRDGDMFKGIRRKRRQKAEDKEYRSKEEKKQIENKFQGE